MGGVAAFELVDLVGSGVKGLLRGDGFWDDAGGAWGGGYCLGAVGCAGAGFGVVGYHYVVLLN